MFLNPPSGRAIQQWTSKAKAETADGNADLVAAILPVRTDTHWWHEDTANNATVFFLRGRLSFGSGGQSAPFPSALILWGGTPDSGRGHQNGFAWRVATRRAAGAKRKLIADCAKAP